MEQVADAPASTLGVVRLNVLGPLQVEQADRDVVIRAAKERSLLFTLALSPRTVVSSETLIRALWGEEPPASARKTLQTYISNLRQALGAETIATHPSGYVIEIDGDDIDVWQFRARVRAADHALRDGDTERARSELHDALALWRGDPFVEIASHTGLAAEGVRLNEEYLSALEARVAADLAAGADVDLVGELQALVRDHPYRERLWGNLMVAQYRCGRQADALATFQRVRELLAQELGLDPGGELRRIEEAILNHESWLAPPHAAEATVAPVAGAPSGVVRSPVRYTSSTAGVNIAYQTAGDGPTDILAVPGFISHLDIWWNAPTDGLVRRLTAMSRLISFDRRGMGLSDRPESFTCEDWVDDALAVLDAADSTGTVVLGVGAGVPTAIRLGALHAERVGGLVLFGGGARTLAGPGYEIGYDRETVETFAANLESKWGTGVAISAYAPSRANDPHVREYWARYQQLTASPTAAMRSFWATVADDVTELLPTLTAPTLVLHPERELIAPVTWGRYMAERIAGAEFVGLDSDVDLICVSDVIDEMAEEIAAFVDRSVLAQR